MSEDDVQALRRDFNGLRDEVQGWGGKIDIIHEAVLKMSKKVYVPGPTTRALSMRRTRTMKAVGTRKKTR